MRILPFLNVTTSGGVVSKPSNHIEQPSSLTLRTMHGLLQRLLEDTGAKPPAHDVEGANAFLRASADLRHRHHHTLPETDPSKGSAGIP